MLPPRGVEPQNLANGPAETFRVLLRAEPGRVALTVLAILFLLGLVALPIILLRG